MSCQKYDDLLALFAGGDLGASEEERIEAHIATCSSCRAIVEELRSHREVLAGLADEAVDDAVLRSVRRRVMARIEPRAHRTGAWRWAWAAAAAIGAILVSVAVLKHPHDQRPVSTTQHPQPAPTVRAAEPSASPAENLAAQTQSVTQIARVQAPHSSPLTGAKAAEPLVVKMLTDDPDVVIYWLVDSEGEKQ
ncbi:MAG: zf-HC2 domain-containing protein [Acidobacteria bacterium]|nr:zf-HC2 domain-containing protein [Acidobacteriota bacterium]